MVSGKYTSHVYIIIQLIVLPVEGIYVGHMNSYNSLNERGQSNISDVIEISVLTFMCMVGL